MNPTLFIRITRSRPLVGIFMSFAWAFDGETLRLVNIGKHGCFRTRDFVWSE